MGRNPFDRNLTRQGHIRALIHISGSRLIFVFVFTPDAARSAEGIKIDG
jgi:hypothetical protein